MAIKTGKIKDNTGNILYAESIASKIIYGESSNVATELEKKLEVSNIKSGTGISLSVNNNDITINNTNVNTIIGEIKIYTGSVAPTGYFLCDGSAISRTTYADLFTVIGTTCGAGDGTTTFNLPNLNGRIPVGLDSTQTEFNTLGKTGGEKTHLLTSAESGLPEHSHPISPSAAQYYGGFDAAAGGGIPRAQGGEVSSTQNNTATNASSAHNNLQPYIVLNFVIKY